MHLTTKETAAKLIELGFPKPTELYWQYDLSELWELLPQPSGFQNTFGFSKADTYFKKEYPFKYTVLFSCVDFRHVFLINHDNPAECLGLAILKALELGLISFPKS